MVCYTCCERGLARRQSRPYLLSFLYGHGVNDVETAGQRPWPSAPREPHVLRVESRAPGIHAPTHKETNTAASAAYSPSHLLQHSTAPRTRSSSTAREEDARGAYRGVRPPAGRYLGTS